uniref:epidermal growth factor receptor kinase substrate 8-like n=1 Tax=Myxine glutinosa TaxID=7769 RepID=UPI00358E999E
MADVTKYNVQHLMMFEAEHSDGERAVLVGMRRLSMLQRKGRIWSQDMVLWIDSHNVQLIDAQNDERLEKLDLNNVQHSQAVWDADHGWVLALICQDPSQTKPDLHLLKCEDVPADLIQKDIDSAVQDTKAENEKKRPQVLREIRYHKKMLEKEKDEKGQEEQDKKEEKQKENEDNNQNVQDIDEKNNEVEKEKEDKTEKVEIKEPENVEDNSKNKKEKEKEKKKQKQREKEEKKKREKEEKERKKAEEKERKKAKRGKKGKPEAEEKDDPKIAEENKEEDKSKEDKKEEEEEEEEKKEEPTVENQVKEVQNEDDEIKKVEEVQKQIELQKTEENKNVKEIDITQQEKGEDTNLKEKDVTPKGEEMKYKEKGEETNLKEKDVTPKGEEMKHEEKDVHETKENLKESPVAQNVSDYENGKEETKNEDESEEDESEEETNPKAEHGEPRSTQDRVASITAMCLNLLPVPGLEPTESPRKGEEKEESPELLANRMERDKVIKQILSHCRDDIQRFICKLEKCAEAFQELSKRKGSSSASGPTSGVGVLTVRARPPKEEEFVDSLQKIKYSFNLLSKLHDHPMDPSVDDQLHSLFQSLEKVVQECGVEVANEVITPLLSTDAISLLSTVPSPPDQAIWNTLGDAWHMARSSWPRVQYVPVYVPQFNTGWEPPHLNFMGKEEAPGTAHIAESLVSAAAQRHKYEELGLQNKNYVQQFPPADGDKLAPYKHSPIPDHGEAAVAFKQIVSQHLERNYEAHGKSVPKKIARCRYDFVARNSNEISVMTGEMVEVLDMSRPWWKVRGPCGDVGFVPNNIVVLQDGSDRRQSIWQEDNIPPSSPPHGSSSSRKLNENSDQEVMDQLWKPTEHAGDRNGYGDASPEPPNSPAPGTTKTAEPIATIFWTRKPSWMKCNKNWLKDFSSGTNQLLSTKTSYDDIHAAFNSFSNDTQSAKSLNYLFSFCLFFQNTFLKLILVGQL